MFLVYVTPYRLEGRCQGFGETYCLHLQGNIVTIGRLSLQEKTNIMELIFHVKVKVKQSRYTPWRRLGGEEV